MAVTVAFFICALLPEALSGRTGRRSLLQVGSERARGTVEKSADPHDAAWFNSFALEESSYNPLEDQGKMHPTGWNPQFKEKAGKSDDPAKSAAWFHESQSRGADEALQTHYPALTAGKSAYVEQPDWQMGPGGDWVQNLKVAAEPGSAQPKQAKNTQWFEHFSDQYDKYGRPKTPVEQLALVGSTLRSVSSNLTCQKPGCVANTTLDIYDPSIENIHDCTMSFGAHATDFDDNFDGERIFNILANGRALGGDCFPLANGCVSQLSRELLYSCVRDYPVDSVISSEGKMLVMAAIPKAVDECPYQGNLLHAVATVQCHVTPITTTTTTTTTTVPPAFPSKNPFVDQWNDRYPGTLHNHSGEEGGEIHGAHLKPPTPAIPTRSFTEHRVHSLYASGMMRCAERGCSASLVMDLNQTLLSLDKCIVQMTVNQTDFDNTDGSFERLNVNVSGVPALVDAAPGLNPCRSFYAGEAPSQEQMSYHALKDFDITDRIREGPVVFTARITRQVDECPSNGYLFDSKVEVKCNVTTIGAYLERGDTSVLEVLKLNQVLLEGTAAEANGALKEFFESTKEAEAAKSNVSTASNASHAAEAAKSNASTASNASAESNHSTASNASDTEEAALMSLRGLRNRK